MHPLPDQITLSFPIRYVTVGNRQRAYITLPPGVEISESFAPDLPPEEVLRKVEAAVKRTLTEALSDLYAGTQGEDYVADIMEGLPVSQEVPGEVGTLPVRPPRGLDGETNVPCPHCRTEIPVRISQLQQGNIFQCPVCHYQITINYSQQEEAPQDTGFLGALIGLCR